LIARHRSADGMLLRGKSAKHGFGSRGRRLRLEEFTQVAFQNERSLVIDVPIEPDEKPRRGAIP
jgi:hypothetical protein